MRKATASYGSTSGSGSPLVELRTTCLKLAQRLVAILTLLGSTSRIPAAKELQEKLRNQDLTKAGTETETETTLILQKDLLKKKLESCEAELADYKRKNHLSDEDLEGLIESKRYEDEEKGDGEGYRTSC